MISRSQLLELGMTARSIEHRVAKGRLHPVRRGVYAVGRPRLTGYGRWMAAVLAGGPNAILSHRSAAALWRMAEEPPGPISISVPSPRTCRQPGLRVHRRSGLRPDDLAIHEGVPVTSPVRTLIDLAGRESRALVEAAVNEADRLDLIDPESLRVALEAHEGERGVAALRTLLDRRTFRLTDSQLERRFLPIARAAGLPPPLTQQWVNGFRVDFFWPDLGLVIETDGLRYHRTPAQQARDRVRDQAHAASGLTVLRFTHAQVRYEPEHVLHVLDRVSKRLMPATGAQPRTS